MSDSKTLEALRARSNGLCELCGGASGLRAHAVPPYTEAEPERCVLVCDVCAPQLDDKSKLDSKHWFCLQQSIWSEVPAVQVLSWRLAHRLRGESFAQDLLDQAYLDEERMAWAQQGGGAADEGPSALKVVDCFGTALLEGDSVALIKDLDVKGANFTAKRGTAVKNIHLTDNPAHVEGKVGGVTIVLKTEFLKKA